jgi:hypothetical protein
MLTSRPLRLCAGLLLLVAACGGETADDSAASDLSVEQGAPHAMPLASDSPQAARARGRLRYYGGPVLARAKAVAVLWGGVDPRVSAHLGAFYKAALASPYVDWLSEYDTTVKAVDGSDGTGQHIRRGSFAGAFAVSPRAHGASLTDKQIASELAAQIRAGKLPKPDADTVFLVHFPPGVRISLGGSRSCESGGFCGYHNTLKLRGMPVAYAVLPDLGAGSGCDTGCGAGTALDRTTSVASHELVEAITDPDVGLGKDLAAPLGWYDEQGGEIGDLCAGKNGKLRAGGATFTVQKEWSNAARACVLGKKGGTSVEDEIEAD